MQLWFIYVKYLILFLNIIMVKHQKKEQKQINSYLGINIILDLHCLKLLK